MVTTHKHIIDFADLNMAAIECGRCKTQVKMDVGRADIAMASECPACQTPFGNIVHALSSYRNVLKSVASNKDHRVFIEVDAPQHVPS